MLETRRCIQWRRFRTGLLGPIRATTGLYSRHSLTCFFCIQLYFVASRQVLGGAKQSIHVIDTPTNLVNVCHMIRFFPQKTINSLSFGVVVFCRLKGLMDESTPFFPSSSQSTEEQPIFQDRVKNKRTVSKLLASLFRYSSCMCALSSVCGPE